MEHTMGLVKYPSSWGCTYHTHADCPGLNGGNKRTSTLTPVPVGGRRKCQVCKSRDK